MAKTGRPTKEEERKRKENYLATEEIWKAAQEQPNAEIAKLRLELLTKTKQHEAIGALKKIDCDRAFNDFVEAFLMFQIKESKAYKEQGYTWGKFCELTKRDRVTWDRILEDLKPFFDKFSQSVTVFSGVDFNKIRYLGRSKTVKSTGFEVQPGGEMVKIGDDLVPNTPEALNDYIDSQRETHRKELGEKDITIRVKDRQLADERKHKEKLERALTNYEKYASALDLTPEENAFLKSIDNLRTAFDGFMLNLHPNRIQKIIGDNRSTRMIAAYITALDYMRIQIVKTCDTVDKVYADVVAALDEGWQPPPEAARTGVFKSRPNKAEA